ncbi:MAG: amidohydrolase [Tissierellaceae bacterium]
MLLLKNCNLIDMIGIYEEKYDILIEGKYIKKIDKSIDIDGEDITVIDVNGKLVTPGLIESHCHMGIYETAVPEGIDGNETTNPILPGLRGIDAIDPLDCAYDVALKHGVTTVVAGPGSANIIGGTFVAMKTAGKSLDKNVIVPEVAMKMALGENPKTFYGGKGLAPKTRMMTAALLRESLFKAREYRENYMTYKNGEKDSFKFDLNLHSLMRVFDGLRVKIHAHQADDIMTGIRISEEFGLKYTIDHCTGGANIVDELVKHKTPCIIGPSAGGKGKFELKNKGFELGKLLEDRGVEFSITTDHPVIPIEGLLMQLALYVKNGVSRKMALKAVTINAAKNTDIDKWVGSIEVGKDADVVIWEVGPLETMSKTDMVIVNGEVVYTGEEGDSGVDYKRY